jgi:hypothetical protein
MLPYAPPSVKAVNAAKAARANLAAKEAALVQDFESKWAKWSPLWFPKDSFK